MGSFAALGMVLIFLGLEGFRSGFPLSSRRRITGKGGRIVGALCIFLGLSLVAVAIWFAGPMERERLLLFIGGGLVGAFVTWTYLKSH